MKKKMVVVTAEEIAENILNSHRRPPIPYMSESEIERIAAEEMAGLPDDFWDHAEVVEPIIKMPISMRVDEDVLEWFREQGPGYQTRMNAILRSYMTRMQSKPALRKKPARKKTQARARKR